MELPVHPESDDDQESTTASNWATVAVTVVLALVAVLVILHLTGIVGPAAD